MIIGAIKETNITETRTPITPKTALELKKLGHTLLLESSIGSKSYFYDFDYYNASPKFLTPTEIYQKADIILQISPPPKKYLKLLNENQLLIADFSDTNILKLKTKATIIRLEQVPRSSIAQGFDILSSQSLVKGYSAALYALSNCPSMAPTLFTPAASIKQIKALIIGASITGLEASSILKLNGAETFILDKDPKKEELIKSVEAKFIPYSASIPLNSILSNKDIIISAAFTPNFTPTIITKKHLNSLANGTILIDTTTKNIKLPTSFTPHNIIFYRNTHFEHLCPKTSSILFANNLLNLIKQITPTPSSIDLKHSSIRPMLYNSEP